MHINSIFGVVIQCTIVVLIPTTFIVFLFVHLITMQHHIYITVNLLQLDAFVLVVHERALSTKMEWLGKFNAWGVLLKLMLEHDKYK